MSRQPSPVNLFVHWAPYVWLIVILALAAMAEPWSVLLFGGCGYLGYAVYSYWCAYQAHQSDQAEMYNYWAMNFVHVFVRPLAALLGLFLLVSGWGFMSPILHVLHGMWLAVRNMLMPLAGTCYAAYGNKVCIDWLTDSRFTAHLLNYDVPILALIVAITLEIPIIIRMVNKRELPLKQAVNLYGLPMATGVIVFLILSNLGGIFSVANAISQSNQAFGGIMGFAGLLFILAVIGVPLFLLWRNHFAMFKRYEITIGQGLSHTIPNAVMTLIMVSLTIMMAGISFMGMGQIFPIDGGKSVSQLQPTSNAGQVWETSGLSCKLTCFKVMKRKQMTS